MKWGLPAALAAVVFVCFLPTLTNDFVNWDDDDNFLENPSYRGLSTDHLRWMFTTPHMGHYQPLTWITLGADYLLWGLNAGGYHLMSLLLHIATTLLLFQALLALLERVRPGTGGPGARWAAAAAALFFAIHPLRVESVAWATERKDVLCGFFVMLTLLAYLRMERETREGRPALRWLALSAALFAASLLSKALSVMLPVALLALDVYPLRRFAPGTRRRVILEKLPFFAASAASALLAVWAAADVDLVRPIEGYQPLARAAEASFGLCFYVWKTVAPLGLSPLYPAPQPLDPGSAPFVAGMLLTAAAAVLLFLFRRRFPAAAVAALCYVALLAPVLGLLLECPQIAADRYTYLSCLPWAVLAAFFLQGKGRTVFGVAAAVLLALGGLTFAQTRVWRDSIALWDHALAVNPLNPVACVNRGTARAGRGDREGAIADLTEAIRLSPGFAEAYYNRGSLKAGAGDAPGGIADLTEAIRLNPRFVQAYLNRAAARKARGDEPGALADLREAARLKPAPAAESGSREALVRNNEGNLKASRGDFDGAIAEYTEALRAEPTSAALYNNRADARASKNDHAGAVADYTEALRLKPDFAEAFSNRGMSKALLSDLPGAVSDYMEALRLAPRDPGVLANRGVARAKLEDRAGAAADFQEALSAAPADWPPRRTVEGLLQRVRGR